MHDYQAIATIKVVDVNKQVHGLLEQRGLKMFHGDISNPDARAFYSMRACYTEPIPYTRQLPIGVRGGGPYRALYIRRSRIALGWL